MREAVIVAAARSPIGHAHKGSLKLLRPDDLAAQIVQAALDQVPDLDARMVEDLILGCAQPAAESGHNMARIVAVLLGLDNVPGTTVNRYCSSSLQSIRMALHAIRADEGDVFISAGVEMVSRFAHGFADPPETENPKFAASKREGASRTSAGKPWSDPRNRGELPYAYLAMGQTAENVAEFAAVNRTQQDEFAVRSHNRAEVALDNGFWAEDITPVMLPDGTVVCADDCPRRGSTLHQLAQLKPAFRPGGTVTAGNSCPLNDGAAAVIVMSAQRAADLGITPLARIVSTGVSGLNPEIMGLGPIDASRQALGRAGLTIHDIDLVEINEAFAAQVIPSARLLQIDPEKLNVNGGAIAIGHPFGMAGARIATTLIHSLQNRDKQFGLETMCVGGGQGMAMILERLS